MLAKAAMAALAALLLCLFCPHSVAQDPSSFHQGLQAFQGQLEDSFGAPMPGVYLELRDWSGQPLGATVTGADGRFSFPGVGPGTYQLHGTYRGRDFTESVDNLRMHGITEVRVKTQQVKPRVASTNPADQVVSVNDLEASKAAHKKLNSARKALRKNDANRALKLVNEAIASAPKWASAYLFRGVLWLNRGSFASAAADLRFALSQKPDDPMTMAALGAAYERQQKYPQAKFYLDRAAQLQPSLWQSYYELAQLELKQKQSQAAILNAGKALSVEPAGPPTCHLLRANGYLQLQKYADASRELNLYLQIEPQGQYASQARNLLSQIQARQAKLQPK